MDPYILIAKYYSSEISEQEKATLDIWRRESEENERIFQESGDCWNISGAVYQDFSESKVNVWDRIQAEVDGKKRYVGRKTFLFTVSSVAACALVFLLLAVHFFISATGHKNIDQDIILRTQAGQKSELILPDNTHVWLNSQTTIKYSTSYNMNDRHVTIIDGEAYFDVAHSDKHQFKVFAGDIQVRVHGTQFSVKTYLEDQSTEVVLRKGHVDVASRDGDRILADMRPEQKLEHDRTTGKISLSACDADKATIWRHSTLRIEEETIQSVISKMERWYGVNIEFTGTANDKLYWMTIKTESLKEMLELVNKITPIKYSIKGEEVKIAYR